MHKIAIPACAVERAMSRRGRRRFADVRSTEEMIELLRRHATPASPAAE